MAISQNTLILKINKHNMSSYTKHWRKQWHHSSLLSYINYLCDSFLNLTPNWARYDRSRVACGATVHCIHTLSTVCILLHQTSYCPLYTHWCIRPRTVHCMHTGALDVALSTVYILVHQTLHCPLYTLWCIRPPRTVHCIHPNASDLALSTVYTLVHQTFSHRHQWRRTAMLQGKWTAAMTWNQ